jgi:serine/threonine protein kinase
METGHIKVTDFGGCRPVTDEAKALVKASSNNLIRQLRDGDWKPSSRDSSKDLADTNTVPSDQEPEDVRIEGTTAYLPPEVVIGAFPTAAADVWALGCVMFQCLSGRPPILEDNDELTVQKIVSFHLTSQSTDFFGEHDNSATFSHDEKALIERMLSRNPSDRPSVSEMANDEYFEGMDIFSLHIKPAHRLDIGSISPLADAKWSRRQFSSIWAPQPHAYNINDVPTAAAAGNSSRVEPIIEGEEISVLFYSAQKAPLLAKIRE